MNAAAVFLVLSSAFMHASWNLLAKRARGGAAFVWLYSVVTVLLLAPVALGYTLFERPEITATGYGFILASAIIHATYYVMLQSAYRVGDLSLIYPLTRGTSPTVATAVAILAFGERPSGLALAGGALVVGGLFVLTEGTRILGDRSSRGAIFYGVLTGVLSAAYTLNDKYAVSVVHVPPLLLDYLATWIEVILLLPIALRRIPDIRTLWREQRREVVGVAILRPTAYILVLTALVFTPISYVTPFREISILLGVLMGTKLLREAHAPRRIAAAVAMSAGAMALVLG